MRNRIDGHRFLIFKNSFVSPLQILLLLCVLPLAGCVAADFDRDFSSMQRRPPQVSHPFVGAWRGSWQSARQPGNHVARAIVYLNSNGHYDVRLEMSDFVPGSGSSTFPFDKYWIDLNDIWLTANLGTSDHFQTKTQLKRAYRSTLVMEAMTVQGNIQGDSLRIRFSINDALNELDCGQIEMQRVLSKLNS